MDLKTVRSSDRRRSSTESGRGNGLRYLTRAPSGGDLAIRVDGSVPEIVRAAGTRPGGEGQRSRPSLSIHPGETTRIEVTCRATETFKPGDRVVWWKQTPGGDYVFPVLSTVLAVTAKRIKIEAEDEEGKVIRHVLPRSIEHHASPPKSGRKPPKASKAGRSKRPGKEARRRSVQTVGAIGRPAGSSIQSREGRGPRVSDHDGDRRRCLRPRKSGRWAGTACPRALKVELCTPFPLLQ